MHIHPVDRRFFASIIDRFLLPFSVSVATGALLPYLGVSLDSPLRYWAPMLSSIAVPCAVAASPVGWVGLRLFGLRLASADGRSVPALKRGLIELAWQFLSIRLFFGLALLLNMAMVFFSRRSLLDRAFGTAVVPLAGAPGPVLADEAAPDDVPIGPMTPPPLLAPVPQMPATAGGRRVASAAARFVSSAVDVALLLVVLAAAYLTPVVRLMLLVLDDASPPIGPAAILEVLLESSMMAGGLLSLHGIVQLVLLLGWSASVGKLVVGLRVVERSGASASIAARVLRALVPPACAFVPFAGVLSLVMVSLAYARGQVPFHDRLSKTLVVSVRA